MIKKGINKVDQWVVFLDRIPLWWVGFLLSAAVFVPFLILGEGSVFDYHDQLDEYMMNTILTARHLGEGLQVLPEMMGGINAGGLQPAGILFVPFFRILPAFWAFLLQYAVVFLAGFFGMYFCVKEMTGSSILALMAAGCFCMLPLYPIYGLSEMGIPLILFAFARLWKGKPPWLSLAIAVLFGLASHLVYTGYVVLAFGAAAVCLSLWRRRKSRWLLTETLLLAAVYVLENIRLFQELLLDQGGYVSHRVEMVTYAMPFWRTVWGVFVYSAQHAPSLHQYLILPVLIILAVGGCCLKRLTNASRRRYLAALYGMLILVGIALFYGFCKWQPVVDIKNDMRGFLHYFQIERFYWLYPAGWYLELALSFSFVLNLEGGGKAGPIFSSRSLKLLIMAVVLLPTLQLIKENSYFYRNVNQYNNGSAVTGYISWESYYAEDLMQELENAIGRDMSSYRVAHLGICPSPSLMHGFYTVDGYSNNYSLEYKHRFRRVIAEELEKNEQIRLYFDEWGNRCYLVSEATGNAWMLGKNQKIVYERLAFDMDALRDLGCEYLFSCGVIENAEQLGLRSLGYFETDSSYWGVWLYHLDSGVYE